MTLASSERNPQFGGHNFALRWLGASYRALRTESPVNSALWTKTLLSQDTIALAHNLTDIAMPLHSQMKELNTRRILEKGSIGLCAKWGL